MEFNPTDYITREEQYLANMAGGSNDVPDPITRKEKYLKAIADRMDGAAAKGLPSGGTTGQFLVKKSGADFDAEWQTVPSANGGSF